MNDKNWRVFIKFKDRLNPIRNKNRTTKIVIFDPPV